VVTGARGDDPDTGGTETEPGAPDELDVPDGPGVAADPDDAGPVVAADCEPPPDEQPASTTATVIATAAASAPRDDHGFGR
jgi:hypothetical protein